MVKTGVARSTVLQCFFAGIASLLSMQAGLTNMSLNDLPHQFSAAVFFIIAASFIVVIVVFLNLHRLVWKKRSPNTPYLSSNTRGENS